MALAFVHISDIHFGQEKGGQTIVDDDVKEHIIKECKSAFETMPRNTVRGIIATGDIAYSGKESEYKLAGQWLDRLTSAIGCIRSNVFVVPGNHDIDRGKISESCSDMLQSISLEGDAKLDKYLDSKADSDVLFSRFEDYRLFSEAYDCPIDKVGCLAGDHPLELSKNRILRFVGLNSALICGPKDEKGKLILGTRQRVIRGHENGEELVVLMHHPLEWLQDSEAAARYLKSRARIIISGHEHSASSKIVEGFDGREVLMISAGATVPPAYEGQTYCFNIIQFDWLNDDSGLEVKIEPREWNAEATKFVLGTEKIGGAAKTYKLSCPNFNSHAHRTLKPVVAPIAEAAAEPNEPITLNASITMNDEEYALLVLRFFRDIEEFQRIEILSALKLIPHGFKGPLNHSLERRFLDAAKAQGKIGELNDAVSKLATANNGEKS